MPGGVDARLGEPVVEPGREPVAEVRADRLVQGGDHLQQHEDDAHQVSEMVSPPPPCTAPTTAPIVTANAAGRTDLSTTSAHQAMPSGMSARCRERKNAVSRRSRSPASTASR